MKKNKNSFAQIIPLNQSKYPNRLVIKSQIDQKIEWNFV